jgi:hypothetical protein
VDALMIHLFHKYTSIPLAVLAVANPWVFSIEQIDSWLSPLLKAGGLVLIAVQVRYWWKKSG